MKIEIENRLVQQDLFELLNSNPTNLSIQEEDGNIYLIKTDIDEAGWVGESRYIYESKEEALKDLEILTKIIKGIDI